MRSKLPRRGENSADCAQAQPSERVHFGAKKQPQKKGKARGVLDIRKSFARAFFPIRSNGNRFGVSLLELKNRHKKRAKLVAY